MAPPTIMVHKIPEACGFKSSNPSRDKLKIVGNMIELKSPTANIDTIDTKPVVCADIRIKAKAPKAKNDNTRAGLRTLVRYEPINRPIIAPLQ